MACICKEIQCPYFNENNNGFGCQRYTVAPHCHLVKRFGLRMEQVSQYAIYAHNRTDFTEFAQANREFLSSDEKYRNDLEFASQNDWIEGWKVRPLPE